MADPLHKDFERPNIGPIGSGIEERRGNTVAYQAPFEDPILKGQMSPERQLPEGGNHRLNRTAEQIGTALGKAVSQARRAPENARRGLHLVRDRAQEAKASAMDQISDSASSVAGATQQRARDLTDSAQQKARELADTAQRKAREFMDVAEERGRVLLDKADQVSQKVAKKGSELRQQLDDRTQELRAQARLRAEEARLRSWRLIQEKPLHVLGGIAGATFLLGVSLRIVRSRNASRY